LRLLGKFDGAKMAGEIADAIESGDAKAISAAAHALKGVSANLGFCAVNKVTAEIEAAAKAGENCEKFPQMLSETMASLSQAIGKLISSQEN
jgi:HPt (histidine-containing phosphotransfer) domain-containing protein